ncbi:hypothetical protein WUBG_02178 [Wuchereria bancrofti]|uniref:Uncharacterized protein n=1 Tax=Wuchereria bancrofti TaxID=6293 RepID=J9EWC4_WUCBA|nr:hypothetical protein WUBG_02178 [Wuchereria bancrofti]
MLHSASFFIVSLQSYRRNAAVTHLALVVDPKWGGVDLSSVSSLNRTGLLPTDRLFTVGTMLQHSAPFVQVLFVNFLHGSFHLLHSTATPGA